MSKYRRVGDDLTRPMWEMRTWLDTERIQPSVFCLSIVPEGTVFRLEFKAAREAEAFARALPDR